MLLLVSVFFCFFKQKTAYELRISDWSSDVCSSDLLWIDLCLAQIAFPHFPDDLPLVQQVAEHLPLDNREPLAVARILKRLDQDRCYALRHRTGQSLSIIGRLELAGLATDAIHGNRVRSAQRRIVSQQLLPLRLISVTRLCGKECGSTVSIRVSQHP